MEENELQLWYQCIRCFTCTMLCRTLMAQNPYDRLSLLFVGNESLITEFYNLIFNHYFFFHCGFTMQNTLSHYMGRLYLMHAGISLWSHPMSFRDLYFSHLISITTTAKVLHAFYSAPVTTAYCCLATITQPFHPESPFFFLKINYGYRLENW